MLMRIFISVDMEGIAGVVHDDHTSRKGQDYEQARRLMTGEANAAIQGALQAGAKEIIVNDSHSTMRNIMIESLMKEATLISGSPKKYGMLEGIDCNVDAAVFVGYHTKIGSQGILNHSYDERTVAGIKINGEEFGEFGINALVAGEFDVPVVFVSGCNLLTEEAKFHIPEITAIEVKRTINRTASENLHPEVARSRIEAGVADALRNQKVTPYRLDADAFTFDLKFSCTLFADVAAMLPIVKKVNPTTVQFVTDKVTDGYMMMRGLMTMVESVSC